MIIQIFLLCILSVAPCRYICCKIFYKVKSNNKKTKFGGGANGHTFFYAENVTGYVSNDPTYGDGTTGLLTQARIEASSNRGRPQTGDQDNGYGMHPEVWVHPFSFSDGGQTWHIFRWQGGTPPVPPGHNKAKLPIWLIDKLTKGA